MIASVLQDVRAEIKRKKYTLGAIKESGSLYYSSSK